MKKPERCDIKDCPRYMIDGICEITLALDEKHRDHITVETCGHRKYKKRLNK